MSDSTARYPGPSQVQEGVASAAEAPPSNYDLGPSTTAPLASTILDLPYISLSPTDMYADSPDIDPGLFQAQEGVAGAAQAPSSYHNPGPPNTNHLAPTVLDLPYSSLLPDNMADFPDMDHSLFQAQEGVVVAAQASPWYYEPRPSTISDILPSLSPAKMSDSPAVNPGPSQAQAGVGVGSRVLQQSEGGPPLRYFPRAKYNADHLTRQWFTCVRAASRARRRRANAAYNQCHGHRSVRNVNRLVCKHKAAGSETKCGHLRCNNCTITFDGRYRQAGLYTFLNKTLPVGRYPGEDIMRECLEQTWMRDFCNVSRARLNN